MKAPTNIQRTSSSRRRISSLLTFILHPVGALVLALALGVGMLAIVDVHPTRAQTTIPSGTEVIAYASGAWDEYHQVHLYDPATGQDEAITDLPDWMTHPMSVVSISPDGTKVAFRAYSDTGKAYTLWVVPSRGGQEVQMLPSSWSAHSADWSPDSKTLVFHGRDGSSTDYGNHIYTVEVTDTGKVTPTLVDIGTVVVPGDAIFNKDGTRIIFAGQDTSTGRQQIYSVPVAGGTPTPLPPSASARNLTLSSDGQSIAYAGFVSGGTEAGYKIFSMPVNGGADPTQISNVTNAHAFPLAFSPDGNKLLFSEGRWDETGSMGLYTMPASGGTETLLMDGPYAADWGVVRDVDQIAPTVTSTVPTANAKRVDPTINVKATFSENMLVSEDPLVSSITGKTFKLFKQGSTTKLAATVSYDEATDTATLNPTNNLRRGVTYKAVVTTGAKDVAGNQLDQDPTLDGPQQMKWFFTIRS
jgi:dipeptidyl aminopeptidase/acylaminoacyl peptidase